jgi:hypothetical protein
MSEPDRLSGEERPVGRRMRRNSWYDAWPSILMVGEPGGEGIVVTDPGLPMRFGPEGFYQLAAGSPRWTLRPDRGIPLPSRE